MELCSTTFALGGVALSALQNLLTMQQNCLGPDHVSIMRKREASLIQMSGKYMQVSTVDRLGLLMVICIMLIWRAILK